jgi:predicted  nucleic acid-binding Zn-ribbon protein
MIDDMRRLVRLQEMMQVVDGLSEKIASVPAGVARLEKELLSVEAEVERERAALQDVQKERRRLEMELMGIETKIQKYQAQLADVKTNKEYQAMQHEIDACKLERARLDEKILLDMEAADRATAAFRAVEERIKEKRRATEEGKKALQQQLAGLQEQKAALERDRDALRGMIAAPFLDPFMKVARQRKGLALVPVKDELCGGCHVRVMPKLIQMVRRSTGLIPCDSCKRFLYVPDDPALAAGAVPPAGSASPANGAPGTPDPAAS